MSYRARRSGLLVLALALATLNTLAAATPKPAAAPVPVPANVDVAATHGGWTQYRLKSNGMTMLLVPDHTAPVFTFEVVYHVGSRNEAPGNTGSAHLLEHLLFNRSTAHFGKARGNRSFQEVLFEAGADFSSTNMTTWNDRMTGYSTLPADQLELAMRIEADRLRRGLLLDGERQIEMTVVRNEYEIGENNPVNALQKAVVSAAIQAHPYHWDTIGYRADIEGVSIDTLRRHYDTYFWPDNAEAVLVGDFDPAAALRLFDREFGAFPRAPLPIPQVVTEEPPQEGERRVVVKRPGSVGMVMLGYVRPGALHPDFVPLDVLQAVAGVGISSRLYQALVETGLATDASADNTTFRDPFPILFSATIAPGKTHQEVEDALRAALERLAKDGVTAEELARAQRQIEVFVVRSRDGAYPLASGIGEAMASASWTWFVDYLDNVKKVTAADVQRVAATYLQPDRATAGWFVPVEPAAAPAALPAARSVADSFPSPALGPTRGAGEDTGDAARIAAAGEGATGSATAPTVATAAPRKTDFAARTLRKVLGNGIVLDVLENHTVPTVAVQGVLLAGDAAAPAAKLALPELTARMVQRGTASRSKLEIAKLLEGAGARVDLRNDVTEVSISGSALSRDAGMLLDVLADELLHPAFPADELAKAKVEMRNDVLRAAENTGTRAAWRLQQLALPQGHPFRGAEPEERLTSLDALRAEDLRSFHAQRYVGASLVLAIAGDVNAEAIAREVERRFAAMPLGSRPSLGAAPAAPGAAQRVVVNMPGKANMNLVLGMASGLRRKDPDYEAALLANAAFGQSGMSSRLGVRVRDREGLSYSVSSRFLLTDLADGVWAANVNLAPPNLVAALRSTRDELARYVHEGMTADELRQQQSFFAGNFQVRLGSNGGIATALAQAEKFGYGPTYLDEFPARVRAVTLDQANTALRKHLDPAKVHLIVAGDLATLPPEAPAEPHR
jgi:zinc protease